jgi:hypothetical protein
MPFDADTKERLQLLDLEFDLFSAPTSRIKALFSFKNGQIHTSRLIRNTIYSDYKLLQAGELQPFEGNIRSYWYARIKPLLARLRAKKAAQKYDLMIGQFTNFVGTERLFDYRSFGFVDSDKGLRSIGHFNPHIIIVAEKTGHLALLERLQQRTGATTIALGGQPSLLASEYFVLEMTRRGLHQQDLQVLTFVDYDPSGDNIAAAFIWQLKTLGITGNITRTDLVHPNRMEPDQIRLNRFPLPRTKRQKKRNDRWIKKTGSLQNHGGGKYFGIEADAMTWQQVYSTVEQLIEPLAKVPTQQIQRLLLKQQLHNILKETLLARLLS